MVALFSVTSSGRCENEELPHLGLNLQYAAATAYSHIFLQVRAFMFLCVMGFSLLQFEGRQKEE